MGPFVRLGFHRGCFGDGELGQGCWLNLRAHSRCPPSEGADAACPNPSPRSGVARAEQVSIAEKSVSSRCARGEPLAGGGGGVKALPNLFPRCAANVRLSRQALIAAKDQSSCEASTRHYRCANGFAYASARCRYSRRRTRRLGSHRPVSAARKFEVCSRSRLSTTLASSRASAAPTQK